MTEKDIIDAYCTIRKTNNTIPDSVLNFMKDSAINQIRLIEETKSKQETDDLTKPKKIGGLNKYFSDSDNYENDLYCDECGEDDKSKFIYHRTCASGEVWFCKSCKQEHVKGVKPNEDDY